jgi:hypothetical protein
VEVNEVATETIWTRSSGNISDSVGILDALTQQSFPRKVWLAICELSAMTACRRSFCQRNALHPQSCAGGSAASNGMRVDQRFAKPKGDLSARKNRPSPSVKGFAMRTRAHEKYAARENRPTSRSNAATSRHLSAGEHSATTCQGIPNVRSCFHTSMRDWKKSADQRADRQTWPPSGTQFFVRHAARVAQRARPPTPVCPAASGTA